MLRRVRRGRQHMLQQIVQLLEPDPGEPTSGFTAEKLSHFPDFLPARREYRALAI